MKERYILVDPGEPLQMDDEVYHPEQNIWKSIRSKFSTLSERCHANLLDSFDSMELRDGRVFRRPIQNYLNDVTIV